jgi:ribonuclease D
LKAIYLIDPFKIKDLARLWHLLEDDKICKIFHNASEDVMLLKNNGCSTKNIWDTEKAAMILNHPKRGLNNLLESYFQSNLDKKAQRTNWRKRPLDKLQLDYAAEDVRLLIPLKSKLLGGIKTAKRESWIHQEGKSLEDLEQKENDTSFLKYTDASKLDKEQKVHLEALYNVREIWAEKLDRPPFQILRNEELVKNSFKVIQSGGDWNSIRGLNPALKNQTAFEQYKEQITNLSYLKKRGLDKQPQRLIKDVKLEENLKAIRKSIQETYGEQCARLILSQSIINIIQKEKGMSDLKPYAREIIIQKADDLGIDLKKYK